MNRREWPLHQPCTHKGCRETSNYYFDTRRDLADHVRSSPTWTCVRHSHPQEVLAVDNPETVGVLVATDTGIQGHLFWFPEGGPRTGSGFQHGPGFRAFANDFPVGTRLIVTARLELPCPTAAIYAEPGTKQEVTP